MVEFGEKQTKKRGLGKLHARDVNKLVGWAIFNLRHGKICMLNELVEDGTEKEFCLQQEIAFLSSMTFTKEQAILDEN